MEYFRHASMSAGIEALAYALKLLDSLKVQSSVVIMHGRMDLMGV